MYRGLAAALLIAPAGCERKAPGPEACGDLAARWVRLSMPTPLPSSAMVLSSGVEEIARLCVTTPFDQEVIRCAEQGGSPRYCMQAFQDRLRREDR